jgi:hypothetical protein
MYLKDMGGRFAAVVAQAFCACVLTELRPLQPYTRGNHTLGVAQQASAKPKSNKRKAEEMKRQEREALKRNEVLLQRWQEGLVEAQIPLKALPQDIQEAALDQLRRCTPLSSTEAPSCCMFTVSQV